MVKKRKTKPKRTRREVVDFFAGIKTPSKLDDRRVTFIARKKSPLEPPKELSAGIPTGILEKGGLEFDSNFGLGKRQLFKSKIGIDPNLGRESFDSSFSSEFAKADFVNQPSAIDPVDDDTFIDVEMEEQFRKEMNDEVPTLLDSLPKIGENRIPKTDERTKEQKLQKKFLRVRQEALETGANPLTPEEERNFATVKPSRNFGTTSKGRAVGVGLGRF